MVKLYGRIGVFGRLAYVSQQPWVQNNSVRNNIIFGNVPDEYFYNRVISCCALKHDINILPQGDATEIGEKVKICLCSFKINYRPYKKFGYFSVSVPHFLHHSFS